MSSNIWTPASRAATTPYLKQFLTLTQHLWSRLSKLTSLSVPDHLGQSEAMNHDQHLAKLYHQNNGSPLPRHNFPAAKTIAKFDLLGRQLHNEEPRNNYESSDHVTNTTQDNQSYNIFLLPLTMHKVHNKFPKLKITLCKLIISMSQHHQHHYQALWITLFFCNYKKKNKDEVTELNKDDCCQVRAQRQK